MAILFFLFCFQNNISIPMDGVPLQLEWVDLNGDTHEDLMAVVLTIQTEGQYSTFYDQGRLRGLYEDKTARAPILYTWLQDDDGFHQTDKLELEDGYINAQLDGRTLFLWDRSNRLHLLDLNEGKIQSRQIIDSGITNRYSGNEFNFLFKDTGLHYWLIPDLNRVWTLNLESGARREVPLLPAMVMSNSSGRTRIPLPRFLDANGDGHCDLVFTGEGDTWFYLFQPEKADQAIPVFDPIARDYPGIIVDLDGDGHLDCLSVQTQDDDIKKLKDLKKISTQVTCSHLDEQFFLKSKPYVEQIVPGIVVPENDEDISISNPIQDMNSDGRLDLTSFRFKVSLLQVARIATTGKMRLDFLLDLHIQGEDGRFITLPGGPMEMSWLLNLRHLRMPELAQMVGDFNADGWVDLMTVSEKKIVIHPIRKEGFNFIKPISLKLKRELQDPDQVWAHDINGDHRAEIIVMKVKTNHATLHLLEAPQ